LTIGGSRTPFFHYYLCRSGSGEMEVKMKEFIQEEKTIEKLKNEGKL
jgi:hypothetical protein